MTFNRPADKDFKKKLLVQIDAIEKLGARTNDFADLVPKTKGVSAADRLAVLKMLRTRAKLLTTEIKPQLLVRKKEARKRLPKHQTAFRRLMGRKVFNEKLENADDFSSRMHSIRDLESVTLTEDEIMEIRRRLTDAELVAINTYTTGDEIWGYFTLNKVWRTRDTGHPHFARMEAFRLTLSDALRKLPPHPTTKSRRTYLRDDILTQHITPGNTLTEGGFLSTSDKNSEFNGNVHLRLKSQSGRHIPYFSDVPWEDEVLFDAGTKFRVEKVRKVSPTEDEELDYEVDLTEI